MKIAIYGSRRQHAALPQIARFLDVLRRSGIGAAMHPKLYAHLMEIVPDVLDGVEEAQVPDGAELAVCLGGDGTFLRTALWVGSLGIPIVGVNTGHLGYLAALPLDALPDLPQMIAGDRFRVEQRSLLHVTVPGLPDYVGQYALNEVSLAKDETASMITAHVSVDGTLLADYRADGLIVATSTGSTAYNLSVGGPIVQPTLDVCVITPVAAHSLSMRPMVIDGHSEIRIVPGGRSRHVRLAVDGRSVALDMDTEIIISQAPFKLRVLQLAGHSFADTLRNKLHWGEQ